MFIIKPIDDASLAEAMLILSLYSVGITLRSNSIETRSVEIYVTAFDRSRNSREEFQAAALNFQNNFMQRSGRVCSVCEEQIKEFGRGICEHITFIKHVS